MVRMVWCRWCGSDGMECSIVFYEDIQADRLRFTSVSLLKHECTQIYIEYFFHQLTDFYNQHISFIKVPVNELWINMLGSSWEMRPIVLETKTTEWRLQWSKGAEQCPQQGRMGGDVLSRAGWDDNRSLPWGRALSSSHLSHLAKVLFHLLSSSLSQCWCCLRITTHSCHSTACSTASIFGGSILSCAESRETDAEKQKKTQEKRTNIWNNKG